MYHVQSKYFDIFYDETELYAARIGEPCALPLYAFGMPNLVTHKNVGFLSVLLYREEGGHDLYGNALYVYHAWPFPFAYGTLVDREVARCEFRFLNEGQKFFALFVSDMGRDLLDNIPTSFLVRNLIACSNYFDDKPDADWVRGHYLSLLKALDFFIHKLPIADLPEFLTFEHSPIREAAKEALDAHVQ